MDFCWIRLRISIIVLFINYAPAYQSKIPVQAIVPNWGELQNIYFIYFSKSSRKFANCSVYVLSSYCILEEHLLISHKLSVIVLPEVKTLLDLGFLTIQVIILQFLLHNLGAMNTYYMYYNCLLYTSRCV